MSTNKKNKNLLVLTDGFPNVSNNKYNCQFVFDYVDLIKDNFDNIYVISPQPFFPKFLSKSSLFKKYQRFSMFSDYTQKKIFVFYPIFITLPFEFLRRKNFIFFQDAIKKCINKNNLTFDLIHAHFLNPTGLAAINLQKTFSSKLILTFHGGDVYTWPHKNKRNLQKAKKILREVDTITIPSSFLKKKILEIENTAKNKSFVIPNFTNLKKFNIQDQKESRKKLNLPIKAKILLDVSNLVKGKGHFDLLNIFKKIKLHKNQKSTIKLILIGHGDMKQTIKNKAKTLGLKNDIIFTGPISNNDLSTWYNSADLFVFPSFQESFGIVQLEAMACGIKVLAYANEGSKEVLKNTSGSLIPVGNQEKFLKSILSFIKKDPTKAERISQRNYVKKFFSRKQSRKKLLKLYDTLLKK